MGSKASTQTDAAPHKHAATPLHSFRNFALADIFLFLKFN